MKRLLAFLTLGLTFFASTASPVTVEEILRLKKAGVSDETIQRYIELEKLRLRGPGRFMGRKTVVGPDGKKRVIIYSIEDPAKVKEQRQKDDDAQRKSWEMLKGLVIDAR